MTRHASAILLTAFALVGYSYNALGALLGVNPQRIEYMMSGALGAGFFWIATLVFSHPLAHVIAVGGVADQTLKASCAAVKLYAPKPWVPPGQSMCDSVFGFDTYNFGVYVMAGYAFILAHQRSRP